MPFFVPCRHHLVPSRIRPDYVRRRWVLWTNGEPVLPRKSRCFVRSQGGGRRRYAYELQLHHARLVQPIHVSSRTPILLFTTVNSFLLSLLHSLSTIPTPNFFSRLSNTQHQPWQHCVPRERSCTVLRAQLRLRSAYNSSPPLSNAEALHHSKM